MGTFNDKISAEFHPPRKWVLERALSYTNKDLEVDALKEVGVQITKSGKITCKKDFVTDLASVPRICWMLIAPWDIARAAIIHDLLYKRIRQYRAKEGDLTENINAQEIINNYKAAKKEADKVFLAAMKDADPSVPKWKIYSAYYSVVLFGRWSIIPREED
jgi:hypothetical protein|tara:strand:- start:350 stop:832 length:483 start_codon:yes stop_codon:yes gene_type:complete